MFRIPKLILILLLSCQGAWAGVQFDNVDDSIDVSLPLITTDISFSCWFNLNADNNQNEIFFARSSAADEPNYEFRIDSNLNSIDLIFKNSTNSGWVKIKTSLTVTTGVWHHLAFTHTWGSTANDKIFYDGVSKTVTGSVTTAVYTGGTQVGHIGSREVTGSASVFDGKIEELAFWNEIITDQDINILYNSKTRNVPLQIKPSSLLGYWPLNDVSDGLDADAYTFIDMTQQRNGTGNDGANNTGLTAKAGEVLSYP